MRVDWVHPSWRDLVIESLAADPSERRRFLRRCGVDGAAIALSTEGGAAGERARPLLQQDADWDALGDGLYHAVRRHRRGRRDPPAGRARRGRRRRRGRGAGRARAQAAGLERQGGQRRRDRRLGGACRRSSTRGPDPPAVAMTWLELEPSHAPETPEELERMADWLRLAELLDRARAGADRRARLPAALRGGPRGVREQHAARRAAARARAADRVAGAAGEPRRGAVRAGEERVAGADLRGRRADPGRAAGRATASRSSGCSETFEQLPACA